MKLHDLLLAGVCVFGGTAAFADTTGAPDLLSGLDDGVRVLSPAESAVIRGEFFDSKRSRDDFCNNSRDECDAKYFSETRNKWAAVDRRKFRTDVTRSF